MINRIEIRNFRCFDALILDGLRRFNFIVGESGSGKSALLETLFLLSAGNPEVYFRLRKWRGFAEGQLELQLTRDAFEGLFRNLFHDNDSESIARASFVDSEFGRRSLDVYFERQRTLNIPLDKSENPISLVPVTFKWEVRGRVTNVTLEIENNSIRGKGSADLFPMHLITSKNISQRFDAQLFSQLSRSLHATAVVEVIQEIFPYVSDLSLEMIGGETLIHARIDGFREKIPVAELSGGLNKFISLAVAIAVNPKGVVCIDEVENGFYYRDYQRVLAGLLRLCDAYSVQLFATTHSLEFMRAAGSVFKERSSDFMLMRAKYSNNVCHITQFEGGSSISAIEQDVEIRG